MADLSSIRLLYLQRVPATVVFAALQAADADWWSWYGQDRLVAQVLAHPHAAAYPVGADYTSAFAKLVAKAAEARSMKTPAAAIADRGDHGGDVNEEEEEPWELHDGLALACVGHVTPGGGSTAAAADDPAEGGDADLFFKTFTLPMDPAGGDLERNVAMLPMRVGPQFRNVGLSMWPSAFALTNNLMEEVLAAPPGKSVFDLAGGGAQGGPIRVMEFGTGVGFTGGVIERLRSAVRRDGATPAVARARLARMESLVLTDYQETVLVNARQCVARCCDDADGVPLSTFELLDWTEADRNRAWLAERRFDLFLAADVTYDREVSPDLARTIADGLRSSRDPASALCLLYATHRNAETFDVFRAAVEAHGLAMTEEAVDVRPHPAIPADVLGAVQEAARGLSGAAASGIIDGPFWCELPDLLRRHVITLEGRAG
jgi:hypothetical protein